MMIFSPQRIAAAFVVSAFIILFCFAAFREGSATAPIQNLKEAAENAAHSAQNAAQSAGKNICSSDSPIFPKASFQDSIYKLYETIKHPIDSPKYVDAYGKEFSTAARPPWSKPLGSEILIVDMDTRPANGSNELYDTKSKLNWETMDATQDGGMVSAAFMNHFLYAQIHGYDYRFVQAQHMDGYHDTWIKPHVIKEMLHSYKFVVFIDADATVQHLEVPIEWLFNRWGVGPDTSIAMPIDTKQILNGDENASCDSKGKVTLNTGVVIAQNLPYTFEMMDAWTSCPTEKRYKGCGHWKKNWSHEQRAFSEYIRYDFNKAGNNIVELPCDDAMGYPGLHENHAHILSDCTGQFIRHHTIDKDMTKSSTANAMVQSLAEIMQKTLIETPLFRINEKKEKKSFLDKFKEGWGK